MCNQANAYTILCGKRNLSFTRHLEHSRPKYQISEVACTLFMRTLLYSYKFTLCRFWFIYLINHFLSTLTLSLSLSTPRGPWLCLLSPLPRLPYSHQNLGPKQSISVNFSLLSLQSLNLAPRFETSAWNLRYRPSNWNRPKLTKAPHRSPRLRSPSGSAMASTCTASSPASPWSSAASTFPMIAAARPTPTVKFRSFWRIRVFFFFVIFVIFLGEFV